MLGRGIKENKGKYYLLGASSPKKIADNKKSHNFAAIFQNTENHSDFIESWLFMRRLSWRGNVSTQVS